MEQRVNEEMAAGVETEELAVSHMRKPRQWMPVRGVESSEGPGEPPRRQAGYHHRVRPDVGAVIEVNELMSEHLAVNNENHQGERQGNQKASPTNALLGLCRASVLRALRRPAFFLYFPAPLPSRHPIVSD
jgi:hypothetical protein